ncbi:MAG: hypothetical protein NC222_01100 [Staphylococcus sp.]|nr:hypothetical protein [Staphylococcus sp.]
MIRFIMIVLSLCLFSSSNLNKVQAQQEQSIQISDDFIMDFLESFNEDTYFLFSSEELKKHFVFGELDSYLENHKEYNHYKPYYEEIYIRIESEFLDFEEEKSRSCTDIFAFSKTVYTPRGSEVKVTKFIFDLFGFTKKNNNSKYSSSYPEAKFLSTSTNKYNCHSYAWYSQDLNKTKVTKED